MSDFSLLISKDGGSDQVKQIPRMGLKNFKNGKNHRKPSPQELFNQIIGTITGATEHQLLTYGNVDPQTGSLVVDSLRQNGEVERRRPGIGYNSHTQNLDIQIMPTFIHDCHQSWLIEEKIRMVANGFITLNESPLLHILCGTTFQSFLAPYTSSSKEPDQCVIPAGLRLPTVVIESGWSESRPRLHDDMKLWLNGTAGAVQMVLLIMWSKLVGDLVKGCVEVYGLDAAGAETLIQTEAIFPPPNSAATAIAQGITISRRQLFGSATPLGRNPNDTFALSLSSLRSIATQFIQMEGFMPA